jgi:hypothetical protein
MTVAQLRELATTRLGTPVRLHRTRNICDLRPAYAVVFGEFTHGHDYWAFGDEDVLYGDMDRMLAPHLDGSADLVIPARNGKSGHLTVLKNGPRTNELAIRDPAYKDVLVSPEHWAYDETSWRWGQEISSFHKIVKQAEGRRELSIRWGIPRVTGVPQPGRSYVYDGRTLHEDTGREILYYHWGRMRRQHVRWPSPDAAKNGFAFDRDEFYDPQLGYAQLTARRVMGRLHELASVARHRVRKWRAARPCRHNPSSIEVSKRVSNPVGTYQTVSKILTTALTLRLKALQLHKAGGRLP